MILNTEQWTPQQAWAIYQLADTLCEQLQSQHRERFRYYRWREEQLEYYGNMVSQLEGEEIPSVDEWLHSSWRPGDPHPF